MNLAIKDKPDWYLMQALQSEAVYLAQEFPEETKTALKVIKYAKSWAIPLYNETKEEKYREYYWQCSLFESPYIFESFMEYMEKNRPPEKRFYAPRKKTLQIVANDLQDLEDGNLDFLGVSLPARTGKLLSDDTPVLTTKGFKNHGDLTVGDYVFDMEGKPVKVLAVSPKGVANVRVHFSDKTYIDCHENHEWVVYDRGKGRERIVEAKEFENPYCFEAAGPRSRYILPTADAIQGEKKRLPMPPYTLGTWLGDGTNRKPTITICHTDTAILDSIIEDGYEQITAFEQVGCTAYSFKNLRFDLQKFGMCHSRKTTQKHIPNEYFSASLEDRLELLAGIIDTDGTFAKKENRYHISTIDKQLCDDYVKLISSFNWRSSVSTYKAKTSSSGVVGKHDCYVIGFNPTMPIPCRVERKKINKFSKQRRIAVVGIENIEPKQGNCIQVEGGIYRVGDRCIPTHNSTLCIFFLAWIMAKRPNSHNAMGGHSGLLAKGFYKELLNLVTTPEYTFSDIYSYINNGKTMLQDKSAEDFTITLGDPDRFATVTCRGIDGTWTGAVDISRDGYLYVDDLIRDREHSLSPQRMENTYQEYLNKMVDRKNDGARELMVGTLWNVLDPLERIRKQYKDNPRYRFRKIPALNENDESNFNYTYNGFSTEYYRTMRDRLDKNEWMAKYQQQPFVREGLLFPEDELRYYNGILPEADHRIVSVVDVAWGGGDSLSMPVGAEYENGDVYIFDWVFNRGAKEVTLPLVQGRIIANKIRQINFEANNGGHMYRQYIDEKLKAEGYKCSTSDTKAPGNMEKMSKIIAYSGDIKRKFIFLEPKKRSKEYQAAMDELTMYVQVGKNEHDDAPDSLAQLERFIEGKALAEVKAIQRMF